MKEFGGSVRYIIALLLLLSPAAARDTGQWQDGPVKEWYAGLMQPDNPTASCCGEADAYWCDELHARKDPVTHEAKTYCTITDDRAVPNRTPVPMGTEIEIPDHKLKFDRGNPTGHAIVFLSSGGFVYCFVQGGGV